MADWEKLPDVKGSKNWEDLPDVGEPGHPGPDPYAGGANAHVPKGPAMRTGDAMDAVQNAANTAALGAGPQIEGLMGAGMEYAKDPAKAVVMQAAQLAGSKTPDDSTLLDAYRAIRDMGATQHGQSSETLMGKAIEPLAMMATPIPVKALGPEATAGARVLQNAKVGGTVGAIQGAATSQVDLTHPTREGLSKFATDAMVGGGGGALGGFVSGEALNATYQPWRSLAETQALKAAGLEGGIKNAAKVLGIRDMAEGREVGRAFLDNKLIPFAGSKDAVADRAGDLMDNAGTSIGNQLAKAQASGTPFDHAAQANAARRAVTGLDTSAVAEDLSGAKALALADALERQGQKTPGSYAGANQAKSDAWKSANFADDAPMIAQLYRQANGAAAGDIERQVRAAAGDKVADELANSNAKYSTASDALKLANEAGRRDLGRSSLGLREQLMLAAGIGGGVGQGVGHGLGGLATGIGAAVAANVAKKRGNAATSRIADFFANRAAENTGAGVGGQVGGDIAQYLELLAEQGDEWNSLKGNK